MKKIIAVICLLQFLLLPLAYGESPDDSGKTAGQTIQALDANSTVGPMLAD